METRRNAGAGEPSRALGGSGGRPRMVGFGLDDDLPRRPDGATVRPMPARWTLPAKPGSHELEVEEEIAEDLDLPPLDEDEDTEDEGATDELPDLVDERDDLDDSEASDLDVDDDVDDLGDDEDEG